MNCVIHELGEIIHGYIMFGLATSIVPDGRAMGGFGTGYQGPRQIFVGSGPLGWVEGLQWGGVG